MDQLERDRPPAMVVSDLDGTLLGADGRVSRRNAAALTRASEAGARVVIATGRPITTLDPVIDAGFTGIAVCMNGAVIYDIGRNEVESLIELQPPTMTSFVSELDRFPAAFALAADRVVGNDESFWAEPTYAHPWSDRTYHRVDRAALLGAPAAKLLVHYASPSAEAFEIARRAAEGMVSVTYSSSGGLMEVAAPGVSKGAALEKLAAEWGIDAADVVAFGDMPNDLEMLQWAGRSVAMANAVPEVSPFAREVGPHHDDDGVAQVLERWF